MKTYDERTRYILEQRNKRLAKRQKINSIVAAAALSACSLAIVVGTVVLMSRVRKDGGISTNDSNAPSQSITDTVPNADNSSYQTRFAPEKIYPRNSEDIERILEINDDFSFTMPEFPDEEFTLKKGILCRGEIILFSGQPVHDIYLADLNGDGFREICSDISIGLSGVVDMHIAAFDLVNNSLYRLSGDTSSECHITLEDGKIGYERSVYSIYGATVDQKGALDLSVMSKMMWVSAKYETQEKPTPFKLYERGSSEYDNFLFSIPEYPDCNFELRDNAFFINSRNVFSGAPINTIYLADLNSDGRREICAEVQMVWEPSVSGIIAVDCKSGEVYELSKTGYNYTVTINDGELDYEYRKIGSTSTAPDSVGKLTLDIMGKG